jgi:hypothetical protein
MVVTMVMMLFVLSLVVVGARLVAENIVAQQEVGATPTPSATAPVDEDALRSDIEPLIESSFPEYRLSSATADVVAFITVPNEPSTLDAAISTMTAISELDGVGTITFVMTTAEGESYEPTLTAEQFDSGFSISGNQIRLTRQI